MINRYSLKKRYNKQNSINKAKILKGGYIKHSNGRSLKKHKIIKGYTNNNNGRLLMKHNILKGGYTNHNKGRSLKRRYNKRNSINKAKILKGGYTNHNNGRSLKKHKILKGGYKYSKGRSLKRQYNKQKSMLYGGMNSVFQEIKNGGAATASDSEDCDAFSDDPAGRTLDGETPRARCIWRRQVKRMEKEAEQKRRKEEQGKKFAEEHPELWDSVTGKKKPLLPPTFAGTGRKVFEDSVSDDTLVNPAPLPSSNRDFGGKPNNDLNLELLPPPPSSFFVDPIVDNNYDVPSSPAPRQPEVNMDPAIKSHDDLVSVTLNNNKRVSLASGPIMEERILNDIDNDLINNNWMRVIEFDSRVTDDGDTLVWEERYGFSIKGGIDKSDENDGDANVYIEEIADDGAAAQDGKLQNDDLIIELNGTRLMGATHSDAKKTIENNMGSVKLKVIAKQHIDSFLNDQGYIIFQYNMQTINDFQKWSKDDDSEGWSDSSESDEGEREQAPLSNQELFGSKGIDILGRAPLRLMSRSFREEDYVREGETEYRGELEGTYLKNHEWAERERRKKRGIYLFCIVLTYRELLRKKKILKVFKTKTTPDDLARGYSNWYDNPPGSFQRSTHDSGDSDSEGSVDVDRRSPSADFSGWPSDDSDDDFEGFGDAAPNAESQSPSPKPEKERRASIYSGFGDLDGFGFEDSVEYGNNSEEEGEVSSQNGKRISVALHAPVVAAPSGRSSAGKERRGKGVLRNVGKTLYTPFRYLKKIKKERKEKKKERK